MYKNQLQELAQRSCFNLPSYTCFREGPDHAPRFKASVNFNGEVFDCPHYCSTIRQAEHSAAELALNSISHRGPSHSLAARILDETGVYKNLLQETSQRMGAPLPQYTTSMSATPGHQPTFTGKVELAGFTFTGVPSKTKKQAEKNAAMAAWSSLKQLTKEEGSSSSEPVNNDELEHITVARALLKYCTRVSNCSKKYTPQSPRPTRRPQSTSSRILPLIYPQETRQRPAVTASTERYQHSRFAPPNMLDLWAGQPQNLMHASGANPYAPMQLFGQACRSNVQPVTIRHAVPVERYFFQVC